MRGVVFDVSGVLEAFDYRGVRIHTQEIQAKQKLKLPFTEKNFFKFNGLFFGVCEGLLKTTIIPLKNASFKDAFI
ncbi:hypothetical protein F7191_07600 [Helicobacter pylori]|uniref:hypothetical protein n=1 Tax=Helicobacter pylori TaxID=210 RepID=UPI0012E7CAAF|nr:hypothetical protein [Helicobacter pylori]MUU22350.1 hypothetical protein [Helicobacter pylori]